MTTKYVAPSASDGKNEQNDDNRHIATIRKNAREELRVSLSTWRDNELINFRVWYDAGGGEMRPGKSGFALKAELLPELADAIGKALEAARVGGLV